MPRCLLLLACLTMLAPALAQPPGGRWECRMTDAAGQCIGLTTYTDIDGSRLVGVRSTLGPRPAWTGLLVRHYPNGERRECRADADGRCDGATTLVQRNGLRESGTVTPQGNTQVWNGTLTRSFPNGDRLECKVDAQGRCNGEATLRWHDGDRISGRLAERDGSLSWQGEIRRNYANGDREECRSSSPTGLCRGSTRYTYADGTRLLGNKVVAGRQSRWSGEVLQVFPSGKQMRCTVGIEALCGEDTQIPVDGRGRPLGRIPR